MVPKERELDCGCISGVLRVGWRDPESLAHGWKTDGTEGGQWAIKTFQYPYACEVLSPFPLCLWPFYFVSPQDTLWQNSPIRGLNCWRGGEHRIGGKNGNFFFFNCPSFHHGSQEQRFSGTLGVWKIQGVPSILGWYIRLLSVLSGSCHCLSFFFFFFLIFGCAGSSLLSGLFSSCGKQGLCYSCSVRVSHCSGFSCCRAWALGPLGFRSCGSWALEHRLNSCDTQA